MKWSLLSLALSILLSSLGTSIANVALPAFATAFDASMAEVQWIVLAYLLAVTTLVVIAGRLGDLAGRRRLLLGGMGVFTAASLLCAVAPNLVVLIAARAVQGAGAAVMMALAMAFVAETVPKEKTGSAMGLLGTMSAAGTALGPSLGGLLIAASGWRAIFVLTVALGLVTFLLAARTLPADRTRSNERARFDLSGMLLLATTLATYALAMTTTRWVLLLAAVAAAALFVRTEARAAAPLVQLSMLHDRLLGAALATNALVTTVVMATLVVAPFYLSGALELDAARAGLVMTAGPIVAALAGVPAGKLADRIGTSRTIVAGLVAMTLGAGTLAMTPARFGVPGYVVPLAVITAGYALFQAANNTAAMADRRPDQRGVVSGLLNLSRNLGLITGASAMGAVFALGARTSDVAVASPAAIAAGMHLTFAAAAGLMVAAMAIAVPQRGGSRSSVSRNASISPQRSS